MLDILATFLLVFILWTIPSAGQRDDDTRLEARQIETRQVDAPAPNVFIERLSQSIARVGDYIYIEGGSVGQYVGNVTSLKGANSTLSIPLGSSWTNQSLKMGEIPRKLILDMPNPSLWVDTTTKSIYMWGQSDFGNGTLSTTIKFWKLSTDGSGGGNWEAQDPVDPNQWSTLQPTSSSAYTSCSGGGFTFSGVYQNNIYVPGLLSYNFTTKVFSNISAAPYTPRGTSEGGALICLPQYGSNGLVMFLGGHTSYGANFWTPPDLTSGVIGLGNITFYDAIAQKWYWQATTGSIPISRYGFCASGIQGPGNTYEIYLYGGVNTQNGGYFDDLYVLSIPGFVWFKANYTPTAASRYTSSCSTTGNSQMIIYGGLTTANALGLPKGNFTPDPWAQGVAVVDLPSMTFKTSYESKASAYDSPQVVKDWYQNVGIDSVTWSSDAVKSIFSSAEVPSGSSKKTESSTGLSVGAIIGIVIGVVAVLVIAGAIGFLWYRRRHRNTGVDATAMDERSHWNNHELDSQKVSSPQELPTPYDSRYHTKNLHGHQPPQELPAGHHRYGELPGYDAPIELQ